VAHSVFALIHAREFAFPAVALEAFSRRGIGWAVKDHVQASLAVAALRMALAARHPRPGSFTHHSDRGVQYACGDYSAPPTTDACTRRSGTWPRRSSRPPYEDRH